MKMYYIGDGVFNYKTSANHGYVHKVNSKEEKKALKKRGYLFFKTHEQASNYRLSDILMG